MELCYADDMIIFGRTVEEKNMNLINELLKKKINAARTKVIIIDGTRNNMRII